MRLFDWLKPKPEIDPALRSKIDQAVAAIDPLIKQIAGYERRLAPAVQRALAHCSDIAARIPGPVAISRAAFATDPLIHALFSCADAIDQMFATSQCVRESFARHDGANGPMLRAVGHAAQRKIRFRRRTGG
jgi:hypothetical protein